MRRLMIIPGVLILFLAIVFPAAATVVDFDSISNGSTAPIPGGYAGFTWDSNFFVANNTYYNSSYGNTVTFPSQYNAAFNGSGTSSVQLSNGAFNLEGAYFSTWAGYDGFSWFSSTALTVTGYLGANLVGSVSFDLTTDFVYQALNLINIDRVVFTTAADSWWLMDNMTYNTGVVPLPGAVWLLGSGLLGLAGWRRFRKE